MRAAKKNLPHPCFGVQVHEAAEQLRSYPGVQGVASLLVLVAVLGLSASSHVLSPCH